MKVLFFHANYFGFDVESPSGRLGGAAPEEIQHENTSLNMEECLVALFHIEEADGDAQVRRLCKDIKRIADKVGTVRLVVAAFGHLSSSYASPSVALDVSRQILGVCQGWGGYEVKTSPFGHNKTLSLNVKGHSDAVKHRSY